MLMIGYNLLQLNLIDTWIRYETALVRIPFEWNEAEPYIIGLTIEDGTRFEKEIEAAAPALEPR